MACRLVLIIYKIAPKYIAPIIDQFRRVGVGDMGEARVPILSYKTSLHGVNIIESTLILVNPNLAAMVQEIILTPAILN